MLQAINLIDPKTPDGLKKIDKDGDDNDDRYTRMIDLSNSICYNNVSYITWELNMNL